MLMHGECNLRACAGILTPYVQLLSSSPALARACSPIAPDILSRLDNDDGVFGECTNLPKHPKYLPAQFRFEWEESAASERKTMIVHCVAVRQSDSD